MPSLTSDAIEFGCIFTGGFSYSVPLLLWRRYFLLSWQVPCGWSSPSVFPLCVACSQRYPFSLRWPCLESGAVFGNRAACLSLPLLLLVSFLLFLFASFFHILLVLCYLLLLLLLYCCCCCGGGSCCCSASPSSSSCFPSTWYSLYVPLWTFFSPCPSP